MNIVSVFSDVKGPTSGLCVDGNMIIGFCGRIVSDSPG